MYIYRILDSLLNIYKWIVIIRCLISWFQPNPYNPLYQMLIQITEPVMGPIRRIIPSLGMFDISPIVVILLIELARWGLKELFVLLLTGQMYSAMSLP